MRWRTCWSRPVESDGPLLLVDGNKTCTKCGLTKSVQEFPRAKNGKNGLNSRCRGCMNAWKRENRRKNPDRHRASDKAYYERNKDKARNYYLQKNYGISREEYDRLSQEQGGACAICGEMPAGRGKASTLHVDHDHETGAVRGLLCTNCNNGLGQFRDDPERMRGAARYIEKFLETAS